MHDEMQRIFRFLTVLATAFVVGANSINAQTLQASHKHYSAVDGLSSNTISHIAQDDYGFLWISTWNGLSRFDGYNFYNYKTGAASRIPHLHNRIIDFVIDQRQNIWLRMYDDYVFVLKRSTDQLIYPFENISGGENFRCKHPLMVTSSGDVCIIVEGVGLYKMRIENGAITSQLITTNGLEVTAMAEGYQNDIWLGTDQGIHRMDAGNLTVERKGVFLDERITCMVSNGFNVYAGTQSGKILTYAYGQEPKVLREGNSPINFIMSGSHGLIWFSDDRFGASYYDPETNKERLFTQTVKTPDYDGFGGYFHETNNIVWVRMNHGGFGYYDRESDDVRYFYNDPDDVWSLSNSVYASLELKEGIIWESTSRRGLEKLELITNNIERRQLVEDKTSSLDNEIRALYYDKRRKTLMVGNKQGSMFLIHDNGSRQEITHDSQGNPLGRVYGVTGDSRGNVWMSSKDHGMFRMTYGEKGYNIVNYRHHDNDSTSLADNRAYQSQEDMAGNIWVATYGGGVNLMLKGTESFIRPEDMRGYPMSTYRKVRTIAMDRDGTIWAGTTDGVLLMRYENGHVVINKLEPSEEEPEKFLQSNDIVCLARDASGRMWLGTNGGGIAHEIGVDSDGRRLFENFGTEDGLTSEEIKSITFDLDGTVWFSADYTISSYDPVKRIFSSFSILEGVDETMCSENSAITLPNNNVLIGTLDGYYVIDKEKLTTAMGSLLKLRFTDFWIDDVLQSPRFTNLYDYYVPDAHQVTLPTGASKITFRFASLNYQLQHRVHYQYMLEGYDSDWQHADKRRMAIYEDLPSGTYVLKVRAFLQESPDKYDERTIEITVPGHILISQGAIWVYMVLGIVLCAGLLLFYQRFLLRKLRAKGLATDKPQNQDDEQQDEQTEEEEEEKTDAYEIIE